MECDGARDALLDEVLGGESLREATEAHLAECLSCRDEALEIARTADRIRRTLAPERARNPHLAIPRFKRRFPVSAALLAVAAGAAWLLWPRPAAPPPIAAPEGLLLRIEDGDIRLSRAAAPPPPSLGGIRFVPTQYRELRVETSGTLRCQGTVRCDTVAVSAPMVRIRGDRLVVRDVFAVSSGSAELQVREVYCRSLQGTVTAGNTATAGSGIRVPRGTTLRIAHPQTCVDLEIESGGRVVLDPGGELVVKGRFVNHGEIAWR